VQKNNSDKNSLQDVALRIMTIIR